MAITYVQYDTRGPLLKFCTDAGLEWTVSLETLGECFGVHARETLQHWVREMIESDGRTASGSADRYASSWQRVCEIDEGTTNDKEDQGP